MKSDLSIKSAIYLRAAEIIEEKGLSKYYAWGDDGSVCAIVAIYDSAKEFGNKVTHEMVDHKIDGLWWDQYVALPHVTKEMVAARFRELA